MPAHLWRIPIKRGVHNDDYSRRPARDHRVGALPARTDESGRQQPPAPLEKPFARLSHRAAASRSPGGRHRLHRCHRSALRRLRRPRVTPAALRGIALRERRILTMGFYDHMNQTQIAAEIGVPPDERVPAAQADPGPAPGRNAGLKADPAPATAFPRLHDGAAQALTVTARRAECWRSSVRSEAE